MRWKRWKVSRSVIHGPAPEEKGGVVSFSFMDVHPHDVSKSLIQRGLLRAPSLCDAAPSEINLAATTRASMYLYNTKEDIDKLVMGLESPPAFRINYG